MTTIYGPDSLAALEEVVAEAGGDYVYEAYRGWSEEGPACVYYDDENDCPSCGVGRALHKLGVPLGVLARMDACGDAGISSEFTRAVLENHGFYMTEAAQADFAAFQTHQDNSEPWSQALEAVYQNRLARSDAGHESV